MSSILKRFSRSIRDGSLPFRICNRFSKIKWAPVSEPNTNEIIARQYPGDGWKKLSMGARSAWNRFHQAFEGRNIRTVVWVGGYEGRGALDFSEAFPGMEFYLLEPAGETFKILQRNIALHSNMHAFNLAAGATEGEGEMFLDNFPPANSLLPHDPRAAEDCPFMGERGREKVLIKPLDQLLAERKVGAVDFLIVDTQGYEKEVFLGGPKALQSAKLVMVEMNLKALYVGSALFDSVYQHMRKAGFTLRHIPYTHKNTFNEIIHMDALFCRD